MKLLNHRLLLTVPLFAIAIGCGDKPKTDPKMQRFYSKEEPGMWEGQADTHVPIIEFKKGEKRKFTVTVPLVGTETPVHRIEAIFLMEINGMQEKEVSAKRFDQVVLSASADFEFPEPDEKNKNAFYYIVAKCNLHDMWRVPVAPKEFF